MSRVESACAVIIGLTIGLVVLIAMWAFAQWVDL